MATGPGPQEEEQVYTPIEGEAQTFTTEQEPITQPSFDQSVADQSQQQPQPQPQPPQDPMAVVIKSNLSFRNANEV